MFKITNILVCSDFSPGSDLAITAGEFFKSRTGASFHALHVSEFPFLWESSIKELMSTRIDQKIELEILSVAEKKLREQIVTRNSRALPHVRFGSASQTIHSFIGEHNVDLIILGHKGRGGTGVYLGGLASKIISSSPVPVLIVKKEFKPMRIAGLVDPNSPMKDILSSSILLSKLFSCHLEFLSLIPDMGARYAGMGRLGISNRILSLSDGQRNELKRFIKENIRHELGEEKAEIKVEVTVEKKLAYHLNSILSADFSDLVVMKRHQSAFLEKILVGSETRRMLELFAGNIMVLPP